MSKCATPESAGFYFGLFWCFYMSSQIFGNFNGYEIITLTFGAAFFIYVVLIMIFVIICFFFLLMTKKFYTNQGVFDDVE